MIDYFDVKTIHHFLELKKIKFDGAISNKLPNGLFGTNVYKNS